MSVELIVALVGLALLFAVMLGTTYLDIRDKRRGDAAPRKDTDV